MKKNCLPYYCLLFLFQFLVFAGFSQVPPIEWQKTFGGSGFDGGYKILNSDDDGYLIAGITSSNNGDVSGYKGNEDIWVVKVDKNGNLQWQRCLGGTSRELDLLYMVNAPGGSYLLIFPTTSTDAPNIVGHHGGGLDIAAVRLAGDGSVMWQKCFGGSGADISGSLQPTADGNFVFTASTNSNDGDVSGNHSSDYDLWCVKINPDGDILWQKCFGGSESETATNGSYIETPDGGAFFVGITQSTDGDVGGFGGGMNANIWAIKINSGRAIEWQKCIGGAKGARQNGALQLKNGNFLLLAGAAGYGDELADLWLIELSNTGNIVRQKNFGGTGSDNGHSFIQDKDGGILIAATTSSKDFDLRGVFAPSPAWTTEPWLFKVDQHLNILWQRCFGDPLEQYIRGIVFNHFGQLVFSGTANIAGGNFWLAKTKGYNTIKGIVFFDKNGNGIKDGDETFWNSAKIKANSGAKTWQTESRNGTFYIAVDSGSFNTSVLIDDSLYMIAGSTHHSSFSSLGNTDSVQFAIIKKPIPVKRDYAAYIFNTSPVFHHSYSDYRIKYYNNGTDTLVNRVLTLIKDSTSAILKWDGNFGTFYSDTMKHWIPYLLPKDSGSIDLEITTGTYGADEGDTLIRMVYIDSTNDYNPGDNISIMKIVSRPYSPPNATEEHSGGTITASEVASETQLQYTVRFQNTGTDTAVNMVIVDTLDTKLNLNSMRMVDASHPYRMEIKDGRYCSWHFSNINLPQSNINDSLSSGYVVFTMTPRTDLVAGDTIKNTASVYFDFNAATQTSMAKTVVVQPLFALPVTLGKFHAYVKRDRTVQIEWKTNTESGTDYFEVQRSRNGADFTTVGRVGSKKTSLGSSYGLPDASPLGGISYYRLKTVDGDGRVAYSSIVKINLDEKQVIITNLYPNPASQQLTVEVKGGVKGTATYVLYNSTGQQVINKNLGRIDTDQLLIPVSVGHLPKGLYTLQLVLAGKTYTERLLIQ